MIAKPIAFSALLLAAGCSAIGGGDLRRPSDTPPRLPPVTTIAPLQSTVATATPRLLAEHDVPAVGIAYIADGHVQWVQVHGEQAPGVPASRDTLFNVASMAKPVTAEVALRMASAGRLSLDESLSAFWVDPDVADDPRHALLTPRLVLQHRTGLPNWRSDTGGVLAFRADPGTQTGYSGEGYNYLARFLEEKTGTTFTALVEQWVFAPAGMTATTFSPGDALRPRLARPKGPDGEWIEADVSTPWNAADNLYTTTGEYARFVLGVMNDEGLSEAIAAARFEIVDDQMRKGCSLPPEHCPNAVGHGLGWKILDYGTERVVRHSGQDQGENALGYFVPERGIGEVIFTNGANGRKVIRDLSALLYDAPAFNELLRMQAR